MLDVLREILSTLSASRCSIDFIDDCLCHCTPPSASSEWPLLPLLLLRRPASLRVRNCAASRWNRGLCPISARLSVACRAPAAPPPPKTTHVCKMSIGGRLSKWAPTRHYKEQVEGSWGKHLLGLEQPGAQLSRQLGAAILAPQHFRDLGLEGRQRVLERPQRRAVRDLNRHIRRVACARRAGVRARREGRVSKACAPPAASFAR